MMEFENTLLKLVKAGHITLMDALTIMQALDCLAASNSEKYGTEFVRNAQKMTAAKSPYKSMT